MSSEPPPPPPTPPEQPPSAWRPPEPPEQQPPPPQPPPPPPPSGQEPPAPPGPPPPPVSAGYGTAVAGVRPAGFWIRVVAYLIDAVILAVINTVINLILRDSATTAGSIINFLIDLAYFSYFWSQRGQTLGMMVLSLRVIRTDGSQLTAGRAIGRYFALVLSFLIIFIGVILVAFDPRKQGLHDKIADTLVVHAV